MTATDASPVLVATGLGKRYGTRRAVTDFGLRLAAGEVHGLLGPNGAGKSTVLRMLLGLVRPDEGTLVVAGGDGSGVAGFAGEARFWPYLTARRTLALLVDLDGGRGRGQVAEVLDLVGLTTRADDRVGTFSTGMRQRLALAAALLQRPRLLLLDEPGTGLDPAGGRDLLAVLRLVAGEGTAVLLSSHDLVGVEQACGSVTVLRAGSTVWSGPLADLAGTGAASLRTSDDARALQVAAGDADLCVLDRPGGLQVLAELPALDAYVLRLAAAGVAVRALVPQEADRLAAAFLRLTEAPSRSGRS